MTWQADAGKIWIDNGDGTATLSGTASVGGVYRATFMAANGVGASARQLFTLMVRLAPTIASAPSVTFAPGTARSFTVATTGFPAPTLTQSGALPPGITFVDNGNGTGVLQGTAAAGTGGTYALQFTATNSLASVVQNFTLNIRDISREPSRFREIADRVLGLRIALATLAKASNGKIVNTSEGDYLDHPGGGFRRLIPIHDELEVDVHVPELDLDVEPILVRQLHRPVAGVLDYRFARGRVGCQGKPNRTVPNIPIDTLAQTPSRSGGACTVPSRFDETACLERR
jgi:hypothetical protein